MDLFQIATGITKRDDYYKLRQYNVHQVLLPVYVYFANFPFSFCLDPQETRTVTAKTITVKIS